MRAAETEKDDEQEKAKAEEKARRAMLLALENSLMISPDVPQGKKHLLLGTYHLLIAQKVHLRCFAFYSYV